MQEDSPQGKQSEQHNRHARAGFLEKLDTGAQKRRLLQIAISTHAFVDSGIYNSTQASLIHPHVNIVTVKV
jgi:hypothetical protein